MIKFGTGGWRAVIGDDFTKANIQLLAQGLVNKMKSEGVAEQGIVMGYDRRFLSKEAMQWSAQVFAANHIRASLINKSSPTPLVMFYVMKHELPYGMMITASHNPPEYNGYKVYWEDGAQITPPRDKEIIDCVNKVESYRDAKTIGKETAISKHLYCIIDEELDDAYMEELKKLIIHPEVIREVADDIKIVYSPFNGTGNIPVRRILKELGFKHVYVVKEQELPDPNFTTLEYPNPEDPKAFELALKLAREVDADIVLATDPDADRLGIYAKDSKSGEYIAFNGNMSGMLIAEYILRERTKTGTMPENPALVKTIVTTNLADPIAKDYNVHLVEVLTGFKFIGEQIKWFIENNTYNYVFGLEESYGCLAGTHARDKDAVVAVMCLCEVAAFCKKQGITVWDQMINIYEKYGYFAEGMHTITLKGIEGAEQIKSMMEKIRTNPLTEIDGLKVLSFRDYKKGEILDLTTKEKTKTNLPESNVLYFDLENNSWCCMRPSGTEPKIKFYMGVKGSDLSDAKSKLSSLKQAVIEAVEA